MCVCVCVCVCLCVCVSVCVCVYKPSLSISLHGLPPNFTCALKICLRRLLSHFDQLDLSEVVETALRHASIGVRSELV